MSLLQKLKDIRSVKQSYFILQRRFFGELSKNYSHLMNSDMAVIANKLEDELKTMLCVSLKYSSVKIPLKAKARYNRGESYVNVQRGEPGFYFPQSQRGTSDIHFMNLEQYITDKGDMFRRYEEKDYNTNKVKKCDELMVKLTELKAPKHAARIHPDKLDFFFKILKEVMSYREKFLCYTNEGYRNDKGAQFKAGRLHFALQPKSMDVTLRKLKVDEDGDVSNEDDSSDFDIYEVNEHDDNTYCGSSYHFQYQMSNSDILRVLDYSSPGSKHFSADVHERLKIFIEDYEKIKPRLIAEEEKKRKAVNICQDFLHQLRVHTVPFKVLGEIKK